MTANGDFCNEKGRNTNDGCCDSKGDSTKSGSTKDDGHKPPTLSCCIRSVFFIAVVIFLFLTFMFAITDDPLPTFTLQDAKLYTFNFSKTTSTLTTSLLITISSFTDADKTALNLDKIHVYASYRNQQITPPAVLPPLYLGNKPDNTIWSPYLNGTQVPVMNPDLVGSLVQDVTAGTVLIHVKLTGRLRSKSGFIRFRHLVKVKCPTYIVFGNTNNSNVIGSIDKQPFDKGCDVDV
ncbi:hypothetical protein Hanom_Chr11g01031651 [Helianthus anomalus]